MSPSKEGNLVHNMHTVYDRSMIISVLFLLTNVKYETLLTS